jgi:hypothetical protein
MTRKCPKNYIYFFYKFELNEKLAPSYHAIASYLSLSAVPIPVAAPVLK